MSGVEVTTAATEAIESGEVTKTVLQPAADVARAIAFAKAAIERDG